MIKRHARVLILSFLILATPGVAWATMAVLDQAAVAKLTNQLSKLQEQIDALTEIKSRAQEQIDAIGKVGQIRLPSLDVNKMASQIRRDAQCLKPDFSKLMPSVNFDDVGMGSICDTAPAYEQTLWLNPDEQNTYPSLEDRRVQRVRVERRRDAVLKDAVTKGLAMADHWIAQSEDDNKATEELARAAETARTSQERQQVVAQGQVLIARALTKQNQILAQQLKVQTAFALKAGLSIEDLTKPQDEKGAGK